MVKRNKSVCCTCIVCQRTFVSSRHDTVTCGDRCRQLMCRIANRLKRIMRKSR
jgi:hypothetical protein